MTTKQEINIQDGFLFHCLKNKLTVNVELTTGRSFEGRLKRFDRFALLLESGEGELLVYKHAVATIVAGDDAS